MSTSRYFLFLCTCTLVLFAAFAFTPVMASEKHAVGGKANITGIKKHRNIRVVYDVSRDELEAGIGKALYYVRGLLEAYKKLGVKTEELHISVVLHGAAAYWVLNTEAYQQVKGDIFAHNPNEKVIGELLEHGVSVEICNATIKGKGWSAADILPGVKLVHDGYTRMIDLQLRGYAYIYF